MIVLYAIYVAIVAWMGRQQHTKMQASVTDGNFHTFFICFLIGYRDGIY